MTVTRSRKNQKAVERIVEQQYYKHCSGIQINVMDIGKVFRFGERMYDVGMRDDVLGQELLEFVNQIKVN